LVIPNDVQLIAAVNGALLTIAEAANWEQFGAATPEQSAALMWTMFLEYLESDACMIGAVLPYATETPPSGCLPCDGSTFNRADYPDLYSRLEAVYIVDADTFTTPNLNNRFVVGAGDEYATGDVGGEAAHVLTEAELAEHTHTDSGHQHTTHAHLTGLAVAPGEVPFNIPNPVPELSGSASANITATGSSEAHENRPPFHALPYCIVAR
jgi:microcystin-dependent protein